MPETWFAVEMNTMDGVSYYAICKNVEELTDYVRVNGADLAAMKISAAEPSLLAQNRITETFADA